MNIDGKAKAFVYDDSNRLSQANGKVRLPLR